MRAKKRVGAHPLTVVGNLWRVMFLVVVPVLRGFFLALGGNLADWAEGAWLDILILLVMVGIAVLRWRAIAIWWDQTHLRLRRGLIVSTQTQIPWEKIATISAVESFYLRPLRAVRLRVDVMGGSGRRPDFAVLLSRKTAEEILARQGSSPAREEHFRPGRWSILAFSMLGSNSLAGIVFAATFISQSGRLLGQELAGGLINAFEQATRAMTIGILPPAASAIAYALLAGWVIGFLQHFIRYRGMQVELTGDQLQIKGGKLTRRAYHVCRDCIGYLDIRQSLTARLFGLYSLYISAVGYGRRKDDLSCLIPTEKGPAFEAACARLFPKMAPAPRSLAPHKKGAMGFVAPGIFACLGVAWLTLNALLLVRGWATFILFVGGMAALPALYFLAVRIADFRTGGIGVEDGVYTLRYSKGFCLHTVLIPADKVVQVQLRQSFFQRKKMRCDLIFFTRAEKKSPHLLRNLPVEGARNYLP